MRTPFEQWQIIIHFAAQKESVVDRLSNARGYTLHDSNDGHNVLQHDSPRLISQNWSYFCAKLEISFLILWAKMNQEVIKDRINYGEYLPVQYVWPQMRFLGINWTSSDLKLL